MSQKSTKPVKQDDGKVGKQVLDAGDVVLATSSKGKPITVNKIETPVEQEKEEMEEISLQEFKECPIEYLKEALLREYEIEGNEEIELEYDQMTDSDIEKEVEKMKPEQKAHFKEVKDLLTIQARLKGKIPTMGHLIQTYVKGRFPGIPSHRVEEHEKWKSLKNRTSVKQKKKIYNR